MSEDDYIFTFFERNFGRPLTQLAWDKEEQRDHLSTQLLLLQDVVSNITFPKVPEYLPETHENYSLEVVGDLYTLLQTFQLRYRVYTDPQNEYINPALYPLGLEFDQYDKVSTHLFVRNIEDGKLCGLTRIIPDTDLGLQLEQHLDIEDYRKNNVICESSRYISHPPGQKWVGKALFDMTNRIARDQGVEKVLVEGTWSDKDRHKKIGVQRMEPFRCWHLSEKESWKSEKDEIIYGMVIPLQEGDK